MLNMIAVGAAGRTLEQLLEFRESESVQDINSKSSKLVALANPLEHGGVSGGGVDVNTRSSKLVAFRNPTEQCGGFLGGDKAVGPLVSFANGIWVDQCFSLKPSYQHIMNDVFKAETKAVDFPNQVDQVIDNLNSWVSKYTNGVIKNIVSKDSISEDTTIILANALYFKGAWKLPFRKSGTVEKDFFLLNGEKVVVPYMCETSEVYSYSSNEDYQLLKLPYRNDQDMRRFSMYIFLPTEINGLDNLIQKYFNSDPGFIHQEFELQRKKIDTLRIPKFKFAYTFSPKDIMKELGLTLPFDMNAELTEMVDNRCFISKIIQKSGIEVNEEGTKAASSTVASLMFGCGNPMYKPPPINFIADHPFMFMIREDTSGVVFFLGAIVNPLL